MIRDISATPTPGDAWANPLPHLPPWVGVEN